MRLFSTEQVTKFHPDKMCDQISDAILDACLAGDPDSRVACECMAKGTTVVLAGEITTKAKVDYEAVARRVGMKLGYTVDKVINLLTEQSPEISAAVGDGKEQGAGDQGMMYGYATSETESMLPFGFDLANRLVARIEEIVDFGFIRWYADYVDGEGTSILRGDAKVQVTVDLDAHPNIFSLKKILVSACHNPNADLDVVRAYIECVVQEEMIAVCEEGGFLADRIVPWLENNVQIIVNPAGAWTIGGPAADCGLTGRKIVCDQYGGYCPVGGGAFSGKDLSKVDRSGAYMARKIACDLVEGYKLNWCEVQIAYAIGQAEPMSVSVTNNAGLDLSGVVKKMYDLTPAGIIKELTKTRRNYERRAEGCHFRGGII